MAKELVAIKIDAALLERLREYKEHTGICITRSANEAIIDHLEVVVPARLESHGYSRKEIDDFLEKVKSARLESLGVYQSDKKLTTLRKKLAS